MATQVTTGLTQEMQTYYEKVFLDRAEYELIHKEGGQMKSQSKNEGKVIRFTRYTPLATVTTALSEGSNPSEVALTAANVDATLAEYGTTVKVSKLLSLTSIDRNMKEKIEVVGQNMGETLDQLVREELFTGATEQLANGKSAVSSVAATDTLDAAEIRKAVRTLKANKARSYKGRFPYIGKVQPFTSYDLMGDSTWENAKVYSDVNDLYQGEIGALHGVRFLETKAGKTTASTVTVYSNFVHGSDAFGVYDLEGDKPSLYIVTSTDTNNPAGRFVTVSWAGAYVCKTLNGDWAINIKTGATA
jgi:N4-gp56 family major capsid protein